MLSLQIDEIKNFMRLFLREKTFDDFLFLEGTLFLETLFSFDGKVNQGYYSPEELEELGISEDASIPWKVMRRRIDSLLTGSHTPGFFQFTLCLPKEKSAEVSNDPGVLACLINVRFRDNALSITTGLSRSGFSLSHEADQSWDASFLNFLKKESVIFQESG